MQTVVLYEETPVMRAHLRIVCHSFIRGEEKGTTNKGDNIVRQTLLHSDQVCKAKLA